MGHGDERHGPGERDDSDAEHESSHSADQPGDGDPSSHKHDSHGHDGKHDHGGNHDHDSHDKRSDSARTLGVVAAINAVGFVVELAGGLAFGSVALLSDAFHMLFDATAYVFAWAAAVVVARSDPGERWTYGLARAEPFAAFVNGLLLVPTVGYLLYESYQRFLDPTAINAQMTILLGAFGLGINLFSVYVLEGEDLSLNERGAYVHLLADAAGSVAVIVATAAVAVTGISLFDPLAAVAVAALIVWSAVGVLRESVAVLFQKSPVATGDVRAVVAGVPGVQRVPDVHLWHLHSDLLVATVYLVDDCETTAERDRVVEHVHERLEAEFGVGHATVEAVGEAHTDAHCHE
ncbi:cation diffusion facilitator family transporter [Halobacterium zhouii]|uniref:cation diffusion facilitator family transporter n=1 Tax=Halobacterium zhouii TaxID=2902624 RepID=UPI001E462EBE|nr:cation diffusion facilitator family transporter [Halobacterium zhouii]